VHFFSGMGERLLMSIRKEHPKKKKPILFYFKPFILVHFWHAIKSCELIQAQKKVGAGIQMSRGSGRRCISVALSTSRQVGDLVWSNHVSY